MAVTFEIRRFQDNPHFFLRLGNPFVALLGAFSSSSNLTSERVLFRPFGLVAVVLGGPCTTAARCFVPSFSVPA